MNSWAPYGMARVLICFLFGLLLAIYFPEAYFPPLHVVLICVLILFSLFLLTLYLKNDGARRKSSAILGLLLVAILGFLRMSFYGEGRKANHLKNYQGRIDGYKVSIKDTPKAKNKTWMYEASVEQVYDGLQWHLVSGDILLYVYKNEQNNEILSYGSSYLIRGAPNIVTAPSNPYEFDFKKFLKYKNVFHQHFVSYRDIELVTTIVKKDLTYYAHLARLWAVNQLKKYISQPQERAVIMALTLGITDFIDNALKDAYAASGAIHILAVSGLHVGIIYGMIMLLARPLQSFRWGRSITLALILVILWLYALLTGLSPSVVRAVVMFSVVAIAQWINRKSNIYNTLAISSFILLLANPYFLVSVGFQLSYLAVLGIVYIYRPLYMLWQPRWWWLDKVWSLTCVSIGAQLATGALGLLYFHQFPVYFLVSNLFAVPSAALIVLGTIGVLVTHFLPPVAQLLGALLQIFVEYLNSMVVGIKSLPFSLIEGIYISPLQCVSLMVCIFLFISFIKTYNYQYFVSFVVAVLFSLFCRGWHVYHHVNIKQMVVYDVPGRTAVDWIANGKATFYGSNELTRRDNRTLFHILPYRMFCGINSQDIVVYKEMEEGVGIHILHRYGKWIAIVNKEIKEALPIKKVDYLIVGNESFESLQQINSVLRYDYLILDSSNSFYYSNRMMEQDSLHQTYAVSLKGAYIESF